MRFDGFSESWEPRCLKELVVSFDYGLNAPAKPFDFTNKYLRIKDIDEDSRSFSTADLTSPDSELASADKYLAHIGDLLFARTGSIGRTYLYAKDDGRVIFAGYLIRAHVKQEQFSPEFVFYNTLTQDFLNFVKATSARSVQPGINAQEYGSYQLMLPSLAEQQRIGALFKELDHNLALNRALLEKLTKLKASLLEQMFPRVGESVPQLRFEGFSEPWEQRCLKELVVSFDYGLNAPAKSFDFTTKYLRVKDIDEDSRSFSTAGITTPDIDKDSADKYLAHENDLFFGRAGSIGRTYLHTQNTGRVVFATNFIRAHLKQEQFSPEFVFYNTLTQGFLDFVQATSTRSVQPSINAQLYGSYLLMIPSLAEQQHIGAFFKAMDERIAQQRAKLNKLEQLKQALLEQMFVSAPV